MRDAFLWILFFLLSSLSCLRAEVDLPAVLGDGMVLQRGAPTVIWGWAEPGERVTVRFRGRSACTTAGGDGRWQVMLDPGPAGGPFSMTIQGGSAHTLRDIYVGELWLASGQSNMVLPMERVKERYPEIIATAANARIRNFTVDTAYAFDGPREDVASGGWKAATPEAVLEFGAVGYFFARALEAHLDVPVGIINASVGGSPLNAWLSEAALQAWPEALAEAHRWRDDALVERTLEANQAVYREWDARVQAADRGIQGETPWYADDLDTRGWESLVVPGFWDERGLAPMNGVVWFRRTIDIPSALAGRSGMLYLGTIVDADETYVNGVKVGQTTYQYPPRRYQVPAGLLREGRNTITIRAFSHAGRGAFTPDKPFELVLGERSFDLRGAWKYRVGAVLDPRPGTTFVRWKPMGLYNAMIAPLNPMRIRGVLWYQGESDTDRAGDYGRMLTDLVRDWRARRARRDLPFLWVQLANFMEARPAPAESDWARLRDQQRRALDLRHTGMAVAIDLGEWNDIHPLNKRDVGERLALQARRVAYGENGLVSAGPLPREAVRRDGRVLLAFDHVGGGLVARGGDRLRHFALAGPDGRFVRADARIVGEQVEVWHPTIEDPRVVRYAWASNPESANLYNAEGLPASPFEVAVR